MLRINMEIGFVLVSIEPIYEHIVFTKLKKMKEIKEVTPLFGEYDVIVKIELKNFDEIGDIVINKIRTIKGVVKTKTLSGFKLRTHFK